MSELTAVEQTGSASETSSAKPVSWRDVLPIHPAAELFPPLPPDEPRALGEDIKANGMRMPVTLLHQQSKPHYVLVDGVCRLDALEMVGLDATAPRRWMIGPPNVSLLGPGCLVTGSFSDTLRTQI
jgi:hypothetical protein